MDGGRELSSRTIRNAAWLGQQLEGRWGGGYQGTRCSISTVEQQDQTFAGQIFMARRASTSSKLAGSVQAVSAISVAVVSINVQLGEHAEQFRYADVSRRCQQRRGMRVLIGHHEISK